VKVNASLLCQERLFTSNLMLRVCVCVRLKKMSNHSRCRLEKAFFRVGSHRRRSVLPEMLFAMENKMDLLAVADDKYLFIQTETNGDRRNSFHRQKLL